MAASSGGAAPGVQLHARYKDAVETVECTAADGTAVVASPSFLEVDSVAACTVMLTRDNPTVPVRKEDVEAAVYSSLRNELVRPTISTIRKYNNDNRIICVRFASAASADALIDKKTLLVNDVVCTVSRYGETLLRIQLSHVPMTAKLDEVIEIVKHIGIVKRVTRPLIHGYEDHLVQIALVPNGNVDLSEEQKITTRSAKFGGRRTNVQYRCLDEIAFCPVCNDVGHTNGPRCPLARRCLICNKKGHMKRNCPDRHAQSGRDETIEEEDQGPPPGAEQPPPARRPAPLPPPGDPENLTSTGLPPMERTWGSFDAGISEIEFEARRSRSPLDSKHAKYSISRKAVTPGENDSRRPEAVRKNQGTT